MEDRQKEFRNPLDQRKRKLQLKLEQLNENTMKRFEIKTDFGN